MIWTFEETVIQQDNVHKDTVHVKIQPEIKSQVCVKKHRYPSRILPDSWWWLPKGPGQGETLTLWLSIVLTALKNK